MASSSAPRSSTTQVFRPFGMSLEGYRQLCEDIHSPQNFQQRVNKLLHGVPQNCIPKPRVLVTNPDENDNCYLGMPTQLQPKPIVHAPLAFDPFDLTPKTMVELNQVEGIEWIVPKLWVKRDLLTLINILPSLTAVHALRFTEDYKTENGHAIPTLKLPPHIRRVTFHNAFILFKSCQPTIFFDLTQAPNTVLEHQVNLALLNDDIVFGNARSVFPLNYSVKMQDDNPGSAAMVLVQFYGKPPEWLDTESAYAAHPHMANMLKKVLVNIDKTQQYIVCDLPYSLEPHKDVNTEKNHEHSGAIESLLRIIHNELCPKLQNPNNLIQHPKLERHYTRQDTIQEVLSQTITPENFENNLVLNALKAAFPEKETLTNQENFFADNFATIAGQLSASGQTLVLRTQEQRGLFGQKFCTMVAEVRDPMPPPNPHNQANV